MSVCARVRACVRACVRVCVCVKLCVSVYACVSPTPPLSFWSAVVAMLPSTERKLRNVHTPPLPIYTCP